MDFDAIVVGSGMSGGWAAKELAERGLKTLVIERGGRVEHGTDYLDGAMPWELPNFGMVPEEEVQEHYPIQSRCYAFSSATKHFWVKDSEHPYTHPDDHPFVWLRGYHLGGRSIMWGRQSYRMSPMDFAANRADGVGIDWPIGYEDLSPWYDHVETFAGISGAADGLEQLPDGKFLPPMDMTDAEKDFKAKVEAKYPGRRVIIGRAANLTATTPEQEELGRGPCQYRSFCERGCSYGAYFSSLSATLPAAERTGNLTILADTIVHSVVYDPKTGRASGVRVIDAKTKEGRTIGARLVFLCASTIPTAQIMLNSVSEEFPNGIANRSDAVGRYLSDHVAGMGANGLYPGFEDRYHRGRRPNGFYIPRYRNVTEPAGFHRGFGFQGSAYRVGWGRGNGKPGVGKAFKESLHSPGPWQIFLWGFGEMLPRADNRVTLHADRKDQWGMPIVHIDCSYGPNERAMIDQANADAVEMLTMAGCTNVQAHRNNGTVGFGIHEMGTVRMGRDPATSVLNRHNQAHDVPNLYVTDGSCMTSTGCQNPSLTYMAMSARAAHHAAESLREGRL